MDKSIKQLADEIGVSKTAINKRIDKLGCRNQLSKIANQWFIPEDIVNTIIDSYSTDNQSATNQQPIGNQVSDEVVALIKQLEVKDKQLEAKDKQLEAKDKQIEAMAKQIETISKVTEQAQYLVAMNSRMLEALEDKQQKVVDEEPKKKRFLFF